MVWLRNEDGAVGPLAIYLTSVFQGCKTSLSCYLLRLSMILFVDWRPLLSESVHQIPPVPILDCSITKNQVVHGGKQCVVIFYNTGTLDVIMITCFWKIFCSWKSCDNGCKSDHCTDFEWSVVDIFWHYCRLK